MSYENIRKPSRWTVARAEKRRLEILRAKQKIIRTDNPFEDDIKAKGTDMGLNAATSSKNQSQQDSPTYKEKEEDVCDTPHNFHFHESELKGNSCNQPVDLCHCEQPSTSADHTINSCLEERLPDAATLFDELFDGDDAFSCCDDLEVHLLEEAPDSPGNIEEGLNEGYSDSENDLRDSADENREDEDGSSMSSSDEDDSNVFTFNHLSLQANLRVVKNRTVKEAILLEMDVNLRYNAPYEALIWHLQCKNTEYGFKFFPTTKEELWRILNKSGAGLKKHGYCNSCRSDIGIYQDLPNQVVCDCGFTVLKSKLKWFVGLSLRKQLRRFLSLPGIVQCLRYREDRQKRAPDTLEDLLDGAEYQRLQELEGGLDNAFNYSYIFNTDGFRLGSSSSISAWPIYVKLNELIPNLRQKYVFLVCLIIDSKDPNMTTIMRPFVKEANLLSTHGLTWKPDGINEVRSKFFPTCLSVDAKARCAILNMSQYNGHYGCTFCDHHGVHIGGSVKYPAHPHPDVPGPTVLRSDESIRRNMLNAHAQGQWLNGVHGPAEIMNLLHFDLLKGNCMDDLHPFYSGVAKFVTELILTVARPENMGYGQLVALIDQRLLHIKTPTIISRKPRSIGERAKYKGSEWKNWLLYLGAPILHGLLPARFVNHFKTLSYAIFLLSQDIITPDDLDNAERLLNNFVHRFEELYGTENMRYNVHILTHAVFGVRNWGPLWATSTFKFESWNHRLLQKVTSPKEAIDQIVNRYLMYQHLTVCMDRDPDISEEVKMDVNSIMNKPKRKIVQQLHPHVYGLGSSVERPPSDQEALILQREGFNCGLLIEFTSLLVKGVEYRSTQRASVTKSDDTEVYTWDDTFSSIDRVVAFAHDNTTVCGFFVAEREIELPFPQAPHIAKIVSDAELMHFMPVEKVRCPAVKIPIEADVYVVPMNNTMDID